VRDLWLKRGTVEKELERRSPRRKKNRFPQSKITRRIWEKKKGRGEAPEKKVLTLIEKRNGIFKGSLY